MNAARRVRGWTRSLLLRAGLATGRGSSIGGTRQAVHPFAFLDRGPSWTGAILVRHYSFLPASANLSGAASKIFLSSSEQK
jgi:hypothetical protein